MKKILGALMMCTALVAPQAAIARPVEITVEMKNFRGPKAYAGIYLVNPDGSFHSDLAVAGKEAKYQAHLRGWYRGVSRSGRVDGVTGASVGGGRTITITADIADALINAGYKVQVDTAVEDFGEHRAEASVDLAVSGQAVPGRGFVQSLSVKM